jgi:alpha-glucuronidase
MIDTLRQVIEQVEQLGPDEQSIIAERFQRVLEELEDEREWAEIWRDPRSIEVLEQLMAEAIAEDEAGETEEGGWVLP